MRNFDVESMIELRDNIEKIHSRCADILFNLWHKHKNGSTYYPLLKYLKISINSLFYDFDSDALYEIGECVGEPYETLRAYHEFFQTKPNDNSTIGIEEISFALIQFDNKLYEKLCELDDELGC